MKDRLAANIVKYRKVILLLMLLLTVGTAACIVRTRINYDLTHYLASDNRFLIRILKS